MHNSYDAPIDQVTTTPRFWSDGPEFQEVFAGESASGEPEELLDAPLGTYLREEHDAVILSAPTSGLLDTISRVTSAVTDADFGQLPPDLSERHG